MEESQEKNRGKSIVQNSLIGIQQTVLNSGKDKFLLSGRRQKLNLDSESLLLKDYQNIQGGLG